MFGQGKAMKNGDKMQISTNLPAELLSEGIFVRIRHYE